MAELMFVRFKNGIKNLDILYSLSPRLTTHSLNTTERGILNLAGRRGEGAEDGWSQRKVSAAGL